MADNSPGSPLAGGNVNLETGVLIPYVLVKLADGTLALRHPDELSRPAATPAAPPADKTGGKK